MQLSQDRLIIFVLTSAKNKLNTEHSSILMFSNPVSAEERYNVRISTVPHIRMACAHPVAMKTARPVGIIHEDRALETVIAPEVA